ncbi:MAG: class I SAM-dependent methyltransferase, partial [Pyrinomonadaceae bacterium]
MTIVKELFTRPVSRFIASQLRKPHGFFASRIGREMNISNAAVYGLTLSAIEPSDGDSILEIGFGNGKFFPDLFAKAAGLNVYGLELSAKMVATARSNNSETTAAGQLDLYLGSSDKMVFWN